MSTSNNITTRGKRRHVDKAVSAKKSGRQPRSLSRSLACCVPALVVCVLHRFLVRALRFASSCDFEHTDCFRIASSILGCSQNPILCCMFSEFRTYWTCDHHHHHHHHHHSSSLDSLLKFSSSFVSLNKVLVELLCVCVFLNPFVL